MLTIRLYMYEIGLCSADVGVKLFFSTLGRKESVKSNGIMRMRMHNEIYCFFSFFFSFVHSQVK